MILINPQFNRIKKLGIFARYVSISLPIGIGTLAGYLLANNKQVKILDDQVTPVNEQILKEYVKDLSAPYIFGISCFTAGIGRGYQIAQFIKRRYPDSYVIMGGIHPTVLPEEVLNSGYVDIVVRREGDKTIILLYDALKNGKDFTEILGISYRDENNKIIHNQDAPLFSDLNLLPLFPYHLFESHIDKYDLGFILSSRGCPYNCIFCSQRQISGRWYRYVEPERVIEELDLLIHKYQQKDISFFDDNFIIDRERTKRLCDLMYKNGYYKNTVFCCQTRGDAVDDEILEYLKKAGFTTIGFGLETGSERLMKLLNKGETVQQNIKGVRLAKKHGFKVMGNFILGLPTETKQERELAYKLTKSLDLDIVKFNNATPYPGTKLYKIALEEGGLNAGENWKNLCACGTFVEGPFSQAPLAYCPKTSTEKELRKAILKANFFFWLNPKQIIRLFKKGSVTGGWFVFEKGWYLKPKEWYYLSRLGTRAILSFLKIFI